ncbi:acyltransferase [Nocardioides mesophilus]|uniref:Acyltransferase n=1 Tax=Nocardioides mesophilus TaxID=433659 RepID=A0A7G9REF4_9ACTN|nr:acyltransferase [Nocardioides mesophilus]QNN53979.1 acyltransferase [Nocardioides mesophilus]
MIRKLGARLTRFSERARAQFYGAFVHGVKVEGKTRVGRGATLRVQSGGRIALRDARIEPFARLDASAGANLDIGSAFIGRYVIVAARESVEISDECRIAEWSTIRDHEHVYSPETGSISDEWTTAPIVLERRVWVGSKATITAGVTIGARCAVGANAVVTKSFAPGSVIVGVPARKLN